MEETEKKPEKSAGGRLRSPPYPFISLPKAVERVSVLHGQAQHHAVGKEVLASAWGYSPKSSGLIQTAAALLHFGLLNDEGSGDNRRFQLTNDGLRIVQDADPTSEKRRGALVRAALSPKIHKELWEKYGASAGDVVLKNYLTLDRREAGESPFTGTAADDLIAEYKETITYAELEKNAGQTLPKEGIKEGDGSGEGNGHVNNDPPEPPSLPAGAKIMQGERIIFTEEESPQQHLRLIAAGDLNEYLLDALDNFVERQRKRLGIKTNDKKPN